MTIDHNPPDLKLGNLELWIHGREFEEAQDYWDGNWLRATARCAAPGAQVRLSGAFIRITELSEWAAECRHLLAGTAHSARLDTIEPELKVSIEKRDAVGHMTLVVEISPNHNEQQHKFTFEIDQSYLPGVIREIERLEERFPVRGSPGSS